MKTMARRTHTHRSATACAAALLAATLAGLAPGTEAKASVPPMSRHEIVARAESAVGSAYTWGGESWKPDSGGTGPDCSGLVLKCWEAPRTLLYQEEDGVNASISPRYTTYHFYNNLGPWTPLTDRASLLPGDALVYNDGSSGHVVLYAEGDAWNYPIVYEAPYTGATVRRSARYLSGAYEPRRRSNLSDSSILLDNPTAASVGGSDIAGNWTRSTSNPGYYGHDYQVQAATTATAWARYTPRLPVTGYYNIYVRWTDGWNRASNARITINTPSAMSTRYVDQRSGGGAWYKLGRFYLPAGYSPAKGSVSIHATGANGYVVADAVLFAPTR